MSERANFKIKWKWIIQIVSSECLFGGKIDVSLKRLAEVSVLCHSELTWNHISYESASDERWHNYLRTATIWYNLNDDRINKSTNYVEEEKTNQTTMIPTDPVLIKVAEQKSCCGKAEKKTTQKMYNDKIIEKIKPLAMKIPF